MQPTTVFFEIKNCPLVSVSHLKIVVLLYAHPNRTNMDPISNCIHLACTEIRAENLSGECNWLREFG